MAARMDSIHVALPSVESFCWAMIFATIVAPILVYLHDFVREPPL